MAVNRPTDVKIKDRDINNKLQLYGIFEAFSNGKVPSNKQIDVALNSLLASDALAKPSSKLSEEGRALVGDLREVIKEAKYLLLHKNEGNLIQDFIWQTQNATTGNASTPNAPVDKETAKQHGNQALDGLRTLGSLIISNGQFRKLLNDATILLRDIAGDAASKAADKVNPNQEDLDQIDKPAEDNVWHDNPDVGGYKEKIKSVASKNKPLSRDDLKDAAGDATQTAHPSGERDPAAAADSTANAKLEGQEDTGADPKEGGRAGINSVANKASDNIPDETKDRVKGTKEDALRKKDEYKGRSKDYLKSKMPEERRDQAIWRLKKMIAEVQGHPDYQQAIETLLSLAEEYGGHGMNVTQQTVGSAKGAHTDNALQRAEADLKTLIERFANNTSTDDLFEAINNLYRDADRDPELKNWFKDVDAYIRKALQEQGYILQDSSTERYNQLYDHGNYLLRDRYRGHTDRLLDEFKFLGNQFSEDPMNTRFGNAVQKLFNDLGTDETGKAAFKPHLIKDVSQVILPAAFVNIRYVPIPRLEVSDPMVDGVIENLVIESDNLMPNVLEFGSDNYFRWGRAKISNKHHNKVMISVSGVQMDLKDVSYWVKKKQGFPSLTDTGLMDIFMGGSGFSFKIAASTAHKKDRQNFFKVETVTVDVKNLNIKLKQSKHKLLFNLFKPIMLKVLNPVIQKVLEKQIKDLFTKADAIAYDIYQEAQRAQDTVKDDPSQAPNIYNNYYQAAQSQFLKMKEKKDAAAQRDTKVNVAVTKHDSIFPNVSLPGGISTKATQYKELAAKGDKWESPVFDIGSASESTDVPKLGDISRKPHDAAGGTIKGENNLTDDVKDSHKFTGSNGTAGFSKEVSTAFGGNEDRDYSLKDQGQTTNGINGGDRNTTLGSSNPVLSGSA